MKLEKLTDGEITRRDFVKKIGKISVGTAGLTAFGLSSLNTKPVRAKGKVVVRIGSVWHEDEFTPDVEQEFMSLLRKHSKDEFDPKFFAAGSLGSALERSQKLQAGTLEISNTSNSNLATYVPMFNSLIFPYVTRGYEGTLQTIKNGIAITQSDAFKNICVKAANKKGFVMGFWTPMGVRQVALSKKKNLTVKLPEDIKGVKIRVTGSFVERKIFEFLGANPSPIAWPETFTSLQKGVCDAIHNSSVSVYGFNFHQLVGTITKTNFYPTLNLYVASKKWYNRLPKHLQEAYTKACNEAQEIQLAQVKKSEEFCAGEIEKVGISYYTPTEDEYKKWFDAINYKKPMWEPVIKKVVGDLDTFKKIVGV
ncbi:TRAP transporter substrate-binding protein [Desulfococcaceae bacterium HSG9]|nr:TRAP transporter substrate-binding protein [Desulfococcaceae bacterium HSG9]